MTDETTAVVLPRWRRTRYWSGGWLEQARAAGLQLTGDGGLLSPATYSAPGLCQWLCQ